MMNLDDIATRIAQPDTTQGSDIAAFRELTEKYPYAQIFSILYLKALSRQNDVFFEDALQKHAYRVTDRMKLYDLIQEAQQNTAVTVAESEVSETEIVQEQIPVLPVEPETIAAPEEEVIFEEEIIIHEAIETPVETAPEPETIETEIAPAEFVPEEEEIAPVNDQETLEVVEATVIEFEWSAATEAEKTAEPEVEIAAESIEEPVEIQPETTEIEEPIAEEPAEAAPQTITPPVKPEPVDIHQLADPQDILELDILTHALGHVYPEQLEKSTGVSEQTVKSPETPVEKQEILEKQVEAVSEKPAAETTQAPVTSPRSFTSWIRADRHVESKAPEQPKMPEPQPEPKPESAKKQIDEIINNFIQEEPSITRPKKEFYSPTKKAKESIDPEGLIYTETLANIFAIQGNYPKAILAYEQLILTNPEKKIFFALRIHELKEKLNT